MIVVDTNIIAYLLLPGTRTEVAEAVLGRDREWAAPLLWRSEFRNILAGYLRRKSISYDAALRINAHAEGLIGGREYIVKSEQVLQLVSESGCTAYDCEYVALANQMQTRLITADEDILRYFAHVALAPETFVGV